jgi:RimJ/RimL family protein N-acetyltransferase
MAEIRLNEFGQHIGPNMADWVPRIKPPAENLVGIYCSLEPLDPDRHVPDLWEAYSASDASQWTYLFADFPGSEAGLYELYSASCQRSDYILYAVINRSTGKAVGTLAFMNMNFQNGDIEIGSVNLSAQLKRTCHSTEAVFLMISRALDDLGYRRVTWKCDSLNKASCDAAIRYGFSFEGTFRNHMVLKSRSRDTCWYSIIDEEWAPRREAFKAWLDASNFDAQGQQIKRLSDFMPTNQ